MLANANLVPFGTTIFTEISRLATEHGAVNLAQGFPDFDGPEHVKAAAIEAIHAGHAQYARMLGVPALNQEIARCFTSRSGVFTDPDANVTVTSGCTEAIAAVMLGLLNPGDEVVLFEPYYDSYRACVAMAGATPRFVTMRGPGFTFDPAELRRAVTPRTKLIVVNTPHNPTGRVLTREELGEIASVCRQSNLVAISDEVYDRLVYDGEHISIASLEGMAERTVTLNSLGKAFSLTGWKIGWAIAPPALTKAIRSAHQFLTFAVSTPMQHAAAAALRSPESYFEQTRREFVERRDLLALILREQGYEFEVPRGGYFIYADHSKVSARLGLADDVTLVKHLIEKVGVAAIPPSVFYENKSEGRKFVRWAFCKKIETIREAGRRMGSGL
ncbi:MAG: aminotransferase class I/II-fold pyridoxal phosphate-dependent enzyme [Phycisphaerales bacterium]